MEVSIKRITDNNGNVNGIIISSNLPTPFTERVASNIENQIISYAFDELFESEPLSVFRSIHGDMISVCFIRDINKLEQERVQI